MRRREVLGNLGQLDLGCKVFEPGWTTASIKGTVASVQLETQDPSKSGRSSVGVVIEGAKGDSGSAARNMWFWSPIDTALVTPIEFMKTSLILPCPYSFHRIK